MTVSDPHVLPDPSKSAPRDEEIAKYQRLVDAVDPIEVPDDKNRSVPKLLPYRNSGRHFDGRWPKDFVKCELNVAVWRKLIREYGVEGDTDGVLEGIRNRFHQGIPDHTLGTRRWYTPTNHASAKLAAEKNFKHLSEGKTRRTDLRTVYSPRSLFENRVLSLQPNGERH